MARPPGPPGAPLSLPGVCLSGTESFGLFSCLVNGEEREQTHRAVFRYSPSLRLDPVGHGWTRPRQSCRCLTSRLCPDLRFIPRHPDELELDVDDPVLVEAEGDDFWSRGFNMRTGERGVFPAFYAHAVPGPAKDLLGEAQGPGASGPRPPPRLPGLTPAPVPPGTKRSPCWVERFDVQFLGSVEVPCHQGNGILCAAMQKVSGGWGPGPALRLARPRGPLPRLRGPRCPSSPWGLWVASTFPWGPAGPDPEEWPRPLAACPRTSARSLPT